MNLFSMSQRHSPRLSIRAAATALASLCLVALAFVTVSAKDDMSAGAKALAKLDDEWAAAAAAKDAERVASFYADDGIAYPPNEPTAVGKEAAKKVWAAYFADPNFTISWKTVHADVTGNLGYTAGTYEDTFTGPDGETVHERGKYLCVWEKQKDGAWKATHDMWNLDPQ